MKNIVVTKFGGTSITNLKYSKLIDKLLFDFPNKKIVCVLSAEYDDTKNLINQFERKIESIPNNTDNCVVEEEALYVKCLQEYDLLISQGELKSIIEASITAKCKGISSVALTGQQAGIRSNSSHASAIIEHVDGEKLKSHLHNNSIVFVAGFQGACSLGFITTLGRGASDLSAIALANALNLNDVYIYTDVPAIYTSDPRKIDPETLKVITKINFEEALEIASFGGKVIHGRAVSLAQKYGTRSHIRDSDVKPEVSVTGTLICSKYEVTKQKHNPLLKACIFREKISLFSVKLPNKPGITEKITQALSNKEITLNSLLQNYSKNKSYLEFIVSADDETICKNELQKIIDRGQIYDFNIDNKLCEISVIGSCLESTTGFLELFEKMFSSKDIETYSLCTNGIRVSALISTNDYKQYFKDIYKDCSSYI